MNTNKYTQPKLPYSPDALEPVISAETVGYHWGKHEKGYIDNLNRLVSGTEWEDTPLEDIIKTADGALFNNAAQAWNHIFYFFAFSPSGARLPKGKLSKAIKRDFGSFDDFKTLFEKAGVELFGSGWVWLSYDKCGHLFITQGTNADNPMVHGLVPLLCFDVWEHAYYIDYQNRRADALHRLWEIVNWDVVSSRYIMD
jgi:Fe-Mn family superoxide dismutase